jgi:hypothetical protein
VDPADIATIASAAFAAVAAGASWASVAAGRRRDRATREPNVSAGFLDLSSGGSEIEFINMGPGLAVKLGYLLHAGGHRPGGVVGRGHLKPGDHHTVRVKIPVPGHTADFIWVCRDINRNLHVWSYAGDYRRLPKGSYEKTNLEDSFRLMYPEIELPPRTPGAPADDN